MNESFFRGTRPVVLTTNLDNPEEGRIFVWAWTSWFERIEGPAGNAAFTPVASSEKELDEWLLAQGLERPVELDNDYGDLVRNEFLEQSPLFPEMPEVSSEEPFQEQNPEADTEHG